MIYLKPVTQSNRDKLWNILQKYQYEMTQFYPEDMNDNGNYHYEYFDAYFTETERKAYFIFEDENLAGFTMLNPYSYIGGKPDLVIAEFGIFPMYRGKHIATKAAQMIVDLYPGKWEIKFNEKNTGAKILWEKLTEPYSPNVYHIENDETVLEFSNKQYTAATE